MRSQSKRRPKVVPLHPKGARTPLVSVCFGRVTRWSTEEGILVDYVGNSRGQLAATSAIKLSGAELDALVTSGQTVLLTFEGDDPDRPVLFGLTQPTPAAPRTASPHAVVDGRVVELRGDERIELRCGKASVVLTSQGKILINGAYISSTACGAHRIRGGSIEIN
jgi:hypothetical protein